MKTRAELDRLCRQASERLHHLSMRYGAAVVELAQGKPVGLLPSKYPGLSEFRDLCDLVLLTRAEINGLTRLLVEAKVFTHEQFLERMIDEYQFITTAKAQQFGVVVTDAGLLYENRPDKN